MQNFKMLSQKETNHSDSNDKQYEPSASISSNINLSYNPTKSPVEIPAIPEAKDKIKTRNSA